MITAAVYCNRLIFGSKMKHVQLFSKVTNWEVRNILRLMSEAYNYSRATINRCTCTYDKSCFSSPELKALR